VDTSAFYALINRSDCDHAAAKYCFEALLRNEATLVTSNFVLSETYTLILYRMGRPAAVGVTGKIRESFGIERISEEDELCAWKIIAGFADKEFSYVDATSFALMKRLGLTRAFSFDDHFSQYPSIRKLPDSRMQA